MKSYSPKLKISFYFLLVVFIFAFLIFIFWDRGESNTASLDDFARCLSNKSVVMYGADWCAHCQNEKKAFGQSFQYINYVECPKDPQKCLAAGIDSYPTWIFPGDRKLVGEQGLEKLSAESGCRLTN